MTRAPTQAKRAILKNPYLTTTTVSFLSLESQNERRCRRHPSFPNRGKLLLKFVKTLAPGKENHDLSKS
jgi:hypothetical protein